ncbi:hypothetical protein V6V47_04625 [Micromonospora sp. CPCC 205539]
MIERRREGEVRPGLFAGPEGGTTWRHPGIRPEVRAARPPSSIGVGTAPGLPEVPLEWPAVHVAFRAMRYTKAIVQSRSVFTARGAARYEVGSTCR